MSPPSQPELTPQLAGLPKAFENASRAYSVAMCAAGGGLVHQESDFTLTILPNAHSLNGVVSPNFTPENAGERIEAVLDAARPHCEEFRFKLGPSTQPHDLADRLQRRGFKRSVTLKYMGLDLSSGLPPAPLPPGVTVTPVDDFTEFLHQPHPFYGNKASARKRTVVAAFERLAQQTPRQHWVFTANHYGHFAGAGVMYLHQSVVIGFDFAILKSLRRQGIGSALIASMGSFARENGARWAVLATSTMGMKFYPTFGFVHIGHYPTFKASRELLKS